MKKTIVITGSSSGIGKAMAFHSVRKGYHVINLCRKSKKTDDFFKELLKIKGNYRPELVYCDLSIGKDIKRAVDEIGSSNETIELLINNAGILKLKEEYSSEGIEMTMAVNIIAQYRLTELLLNKYTSFNIINITSELFKKGKFEIEELSSIDKNNGNKRYSDSKLLQVYYTYNLSNRIIGNSKVIAMHPGVVATNAFRDYPKVFMNFMNIFLQKPEIAAKKIIEPFEKGNIVNGYYYNQNSKKEPLSSFINQKKLVQLLSTFKDQYLE